MNVAGFIGTELDPGAGPGPAQKTWCPTSSGSLASSSSLTIRASPVVAIETFGGRGRVAITVAGGDSPDRDPNQDRRESEHHGPLAGTHFGRFRLDCRRGSAHRGCEA